MKFCRIFTIALFFCFSTINAKANTFTVSNNGDNGGVNPAANAGTGTLRQAIIDANANAGADNIVFSITGTISVINMLPQITGQVIIDGGGTPGPIGSRVLNVIIESASAAKIFEVNAGSILIKGLIIRNGLTGGSCISVATNGNAPALKIQGCYFNTDATGNVAVAFAGQSGACIYLEGRISGSNTLSGTNNAVLGSDGDGVNDANEGNLFLSNHFDVVRLYDVDYIKVIGNNFRVKADGSGALMTDPVNGSGSGTCLTLSNCTRCTVLGNTFAPGDDGGVGLSVDRNIAPTGYSYSRLNQSLRGLGYNSIDNNYFGISRTGTALNTNSAANITGIQFIAATYSFIGTVGGTGNYFGNIATGIDISDVSVYDYGIRSYVYYASNYPNILNNCFGFANDRITARPLGTGIRYGASGVVQNDAYIKNNLIGNCTNIGINLAGNLSGTIITGNSIGVAADGSAAPNGTGIDIGGAGKVINSSVGYSGSTGGTVGNIIKNSIYNGVSIHDGFTSYGNNISQNTFGNNGALAINLAADGVTPNNGIKATTSVAAANLDMDYPVITGWAISHDTLWLQGFVGNAAAGSATWTGAGIEVYKEGNDGNQNGQITTTDVFNVPHGEGITYLGSMPTDANGRFCGFLKVTTPLLPTDLPTAIAVLGNSTSEFGARQPMADFGDLSAATWGTGKANVNFIDCNRDNKPDVTGTVFAAWAGDLIDAEPAAAAPSDNANGDDISGAADEDGLRKPSVIVPGSTAQFRVIVNSNIPGTVYYKLFFDWDNDGTFEDAYSGSRSSAGRATASVAVNVPAGMNAGWKARLQVSASDISANTAASEVTNGEVEDYTAANITAVPVNLLQFNAVAQNNNALLTWKVSMEVNSNYYEIEHSIGTDGNSFLPVGRVYATGSSAEQNYSFTHAKPGTGRHYYRLKMTDRDGTYKYSDIRTVDLDDKGIGATLFPNPVRQDVVITGIESGMELTVSGMEGRAICTRTATGNTEKWNLPQLAAGIYILQIRKAGALLQTIRFVKESN